jgi:hypothetical protein
VLEGGGVNRRWVVTRWGSRGAASVAGGRSTVGWGWRGRDGGCCSRRKLKKEVETKEDDRRRAESIGDTWRPSKLVMRSCDHATDRGLGQSILLYVITLPPRVLVKPDVSGAKDPNDSAKAFVVMKPKLDTYF